MAVDATRFLTNEGWKKTGKDKLAGVLLNVDTQVACWGAATGQPGYRPETPTLMPARASGNLLTEPPWAFSQNPFGVLREPWPTGVLRTLVGIRYAWF
jgi:hypothetical protein